LSCLDPSRTCSTRAGNPSGTLGEGIHHCMGAPIARFEAAIALRAVLDRFPDYELAGPLERIRST
jgi:2-hydroxy-5-methyl-1-naphthoate 7-hydroxylase